MRSNHAVLTNIHPPWPNDASVEIYIGFLTNFNLTVFTRLNINPSIQNDLILQKNFTLLTDGLAPNSIMKGHSRIQNNFAAIVRADERAALWNRYIITKLNVLRSIKIKTSEWLIDDEDLKTLVRVATDQMKLPAFRNANPEFTRQIQIALHNAHKAEEECHERCYELAKSLSVNLTALCELPEDKP